MNKKEKEKRLKFFTQSAFYYQNELGIKNWELFVGEKEADGARAHIYRDLAGKIGTIFVSPSWLYCKEVDYDEIDKVAFHECCEFIMSEITTYMQWFYAQDFVASLIHSPIRVMENVVYYKIKRKW